MQERWYLAFFYLPLVALIIYSVTVVSLGLMNKILVTTELDPTSESLRNEYLFCSQVTVWYTKLTSLAWCNCKNALRK